MVGTIALLLALTAADSPATNACAAKWAQYLDGKVIAAINIKRGSKLCEDETATVDGQTLYFRMMCSGETYALSVLLQHPVDETNVNIKREPGALVVVTLHKLKTSVWWSSLAKHPDKYKTLLSRWPQRGDSEPDPEELEEMQQEEMQQASVDATGGVKADKTKPSKKEQAAQKQKEAMREQAMADWEEALPLAAEELKSRKVSPQLIGRLKSLMEVLPDQSHHIGAVLGQMQLGNGDTSEGQATLRRVIKSAKGAEQHEAIRGSHQVLAQSITHGNSATDAATVAEAAKLYKKGAALIPDDYETYYQLGRHLNMQKQVPVGGKKDTASAAFRRAAELRPHSAESRQMLALRLATAARKKTRIHARKLASTALKLDPTSAMGYVALGNTLTMQDAMHDLPKATRQKAVQNLRTAIELSNMASPEGGREDGGGGGAPVPLSKYRYAETLYTLGRLLSIDDANGAMTQFRAARDLVPKEPKYGEAVEQLRKGAEEYRRDQREKASKDERDRLKQMQEEEDAAWEEDGLEF